MSKFDTLYKKIELFEKLAVYGDRSSFLKSISQATPTVGGTPEADAYLNQFPAPKPEAEKAKYPPIPRDVQQMLSNIVVVEGTGSLPLAIDGDIGPKTKQALDEFRRKFNVAGNFTNDQVFDVIRNTYDRGQGRYGAPIGKGPQTAPAVKPPQQNQPTNLPTPEEYARSQKERLDRESTPPGLKPVNRG